MREFGCVCASVPCFLLFFFAAMRLRRKGETKMSRNTTYEKRKVREKLETPRGHTHAQRFFFYQ